MFGSLCGTARAYTVAHVTEREDPRMGKATLTLKPQTLELARVGVLKTAISDLGHAAEQLRYLADASWPVPDSRVEDGKSAVRLVRESLAAVDEVGWPDTE
jgi:hypothetical protein